MRPQPKRLLHYSSTGRTAWSRDRRCSACATSTRTVPSSDGGTALTAATPLAPPPPAPPLPCRPPRSRDARSALDDRRRIDNTPAPAAAAPLDHLVLRDVVLDAGKPGELAR